MKALRVMLATGALTAIAGTAFAADEQVVRESVYAFPSYLAPVSVRAEVGTTGYGGAVTYRVNPYVGLTAGYDGGKISWSDVKIDGTKYDTKMRNKNAYLNAEVHPWGVSENTLARSLYVAAGVGYIDSKYDLKKSVSNSNDTIKIDGSNYYAPGGNGSVDGNLKYDNQLAPYLGVGINAPVYKNVGLFGEVGTYYTGNPDVDLKATGLQKVGGIEDGQVAADRDAHKLENKGRYEWMPVAKVGVSFKF
ncbi:hypothetical protein F895_02656 [Acinetobacter sp. CIP 64.2]|uniref:ornithine uptake porin CarO n=1 Tax=Acinetobacter TaxID=469 RepID=UPI000288D8F4|nr:MULTISPECIES: ornithine uptake porin CarO [Acinetobacter]ENX13352.1 hypothetical protein F895_02656 [Acinetobacter sp. CIP 64.2]UUM27121.1 ornithine uptake porin CarO [Acinetobacter colistiniresistens]